VWRTLDVELAASDGDACFVVVDFVPGRAGDPVKLPTALSIFSTELSKPLARTLPLTLYVLFFAGLGISFTVPGSSESSVDADELVGEVA
jgi:hypothetical protein